jgi:hypothetical protein
VETHTDWRAEPVSTGESGEVSTFTGDDGIARGASTVNGRSRSTFAPSGLPSL